jgi:salicylic acid 3-hydroxylase
VAERGVAEEAAAAFSSYDSRSERNAISMAEPQLLSTAVHHTVPGRYVRAESERPRLGEVVSGARIPVVDLSCPDRAAVASAIGDACRSHGFFQVK